MNLSWTKEIYTDWVNLPLSLSRYRSFGLILGLILLISAALKWPSSMSISEFAIGAVFIMVGLGLPMILEPIYRGWMFVALIVGWIIARVILAIIYLVIITPIGWYLRLTRKDLLDLKISPEATSYWYHKVMIKNNTKMF